MALFRKPKPQSADTHSGPFGSCCDDLRDAMALNATRFFRVEDNGVLYMTVGMVQTTDGPGWFDQAVIFCPFCGTRLQTREAIRQAPAL